MKPLPVTDKTLLVRTDFSDGAVWKKVSSAVRVPDSGVRKALGLFASLNKAIGQPLGELGTPLHIIDDPEYKDLTPGQLLELLPHSCNCSLLLVVDRVTMSDADHPVLIVDVEVEPGRSFRSVPSQVFAIESNLSIANMDWEDFAGAVDGKGIFRGFPE